MAKKQPKIACKVSATKKPRLEREPPTYSSFTWSLSLIDMDGPFGWSQVSAKEKSLEILKKAKEFETMSLAELGRHGCHNVRISGLCKAARSRLSALNLEDSAESLYSFRLSGEARAWCVQQGNIMMVLWWDPCHGVCPSPKKHT